MHIDKNLALFDHLPRFATLWTLTKSQHFWTTYPPPLANVICERPLICSSISFPLHCLKNNSLACFFVSILKMVACYSIYFYFVSCCIQAFYKVTKCIDEAENLLEYHFRVTSYKIHILGILCVLCRHQNVLILMNTDSVWWVLLRNFPKGTPFDCSE